MKRLLSILLVILWALSLSGFLTPASAQSYAIDILSRDFYPQLRDSWMFQINNQGVAAGYTATQSVGGPFLPTTYSGNGQFQTFGLESSHYGDIVTGISDTGIVVGNLTDADYTPTPYLVRDGRAEIPTLPADFTHATFSGISHSGIILGSTTDAVTGAAQIFTLQDGVANRLPIQAPGMFHFYTGSHGMTDAGLLAVGGYSEDFTDFRSFLYDIPTGNLTSLAAPTDFPFTFATRVTASGMAFGEVDSADFSQARYAFWNRDGTFHSFLDTNYNPFATQCNDLGQVIAFRNGQLAIFDGTNWNPCTFDGANGYNVSWISDFNARGQFVGLALNPQRNFYWGFVASPVPEPTSGVLLGASALVMLSGVWKRRRKR